MPLRMKNAWFEPVEKDMDYYFYELFYRDIFDLLREEKLLVNSKSQLLTAIRQGTVQYDNGVFRGKFTIGISKELSKYAQYDRKRKVWIGFPPPDVAYAATAANARGKALADKISGIISEIPNRIEEAIQRMVFSIEKPMAEMNLQAEEDLVSLGLSVDLSPQLAQRMIDDYNNNQNLNIKGWAPEQIERLRGAIERAAQGGYNREELRNLIVSEYEVSQNKARFLARQETSLFMSKLRDTRYQGAGVERFRWSATGGASGDGRTRDLHRMLHGKEFSYGDPPIIDERTGERGYPGEAFGCRCVAIPII